MERAWGKKLQFFRAQEMETGFISSALLADIAPIALCIYISVFNLI